MDPTKTGARRALPLLNGEAARFTCVWPTCGGVCCKNGRPPVSPAEAARIEGVLPRLLPTLRPEARAAILRGGYKTRRLKSGKPTLAVAGGSCVFYADGCALHKAGASEGDKFKYKPFHCIAFPLDRDEKDQWYVRQRGYKGEAWELDCLDPSASEARASESLADEIAFVERALAKSAIEPSARTTSIPTPGRRAPKRP